MQTSISTKLPLLCAWMLHHPTQSGIRFTTVLLMLRLTSLTMASGGLAWICCFIWGFRWPPCLMTMTSVMSGRGWLAGLGYGLLAEAAAAAA